MLYTEEKNIKNNFFVLSIDFIKFKLNRFQLKATSKMWYFLVVHTSTGGGGTNPIEHSYWEPLRWDRTTTFGM